MMLKKLFYSFFIITFGISSPNFVFAQNSALQGAKDSLKNSGQKSQIPNIDGSLTEIIGNLINTAMGLLVVISVILIIYAAYLWITAQGNDDQVKQAKTIIFNTIIGLLVLGLSYAITQFIISVIIQTA